MARCTVTVSVDTRMARAVLVMLRLPVLLGLISPDRAANIVARFIRCNVQ